MALINYFKLDDNQIDSITGKQLTLEGGQSYDYGKKNKQQKFDGVNGTRLIQSSGWQFPSTLSISFWAKALVWGNTAFSFNSTQYPGVDLYFGNNTISWNIGDSANNQFKNGGTAVTYPSLNVWHHFVIVNNKVDLTTKLYVDGALYGTAEYRDTLQDETRGFTIGNYFPNSTYPFNGFIDDFKIFDHQLTEQEILQLYKETVVTDYGLIYTTNDTQCYTHRNDLTPIANTAQIAVEQQTTNLVTPNLTTWTKTRAVISAVNNYSPINTPVYEFKSDTGSNISRIVSSNITIQSNQQATISLYAKKGTTKYIMISVMNDSRYNGGQHGDPIFNLENGSFQYSATTTNTNTTITPVGNDWYRCTHTITNTSGQSSTDQVELVFVDNSNNRSNPTAGQTVYITGVQTEQLPFQTSFVDGVRNQPYVKIPIKLPTNYQINFYFKPSWSWSNPIQIPGTSEATYNILTYGLPGTSGFFLRYWIQTKKLDCFGATPQFNASQLNGYQMITIVKNNATCKVYVNGSVQLQKEGYTEPAPYYQYLLFGREGYTHQNGLFSNFFVGNQYGNNGQLIWTDDYVKKLYDSRSRFQGA